MDSYSINGIFTKTESTYPNVVIKITTQMLSDMQNTIAYDILDDDGYCCPEDCLDQPKVTTLDGKKFMFQGMVSCFHTSGNKFKNFNSFCISILYLASQPPMSTLSGAGGAEGI